MVSPVLRRDAVRWARTAYRVSERRACRVLGVARSTQRRYRSVRRSDDILRRRLRELAGVRVSYGYRQLHTLLRREGWPVNAKRVYRLYREEGLVLCRKRPKRRRSAAIREQSCAPSRANERWAMDFVHDTLSGGGRMRVLAVIDVYTRECVALRAGRGFRGDDVVRILTEACKQRGGVLPEVISVDNGTEFTSRALDHWAYWNKVKLDFSRPGSRRTMRTLRRSTASSDGSAYRNTGISIWTTPSARSGAGRRSTITSDHMGAWTVLHRRTSPPSLPSPRTRISSKTCRPSDDPTWGQEQQLGV